jgi:hypothetical protein
MTTVAHSRVTALVFGSRDKASRMAMRFDRSSGASCTGFEGAIANGVETGTSGCDVGAIRPGGNPPDGGGVVGPGGSDAGVGAVAIEFGGTSFGGGGSDAFNRASAAFTPYVPESGALIPVGFGLVTTLNWSAMLRSSS